jgi:hypothetical protein
MLIGGVAGGWNVGEEGKVEEVWKEVQELTNLRRKL